MRAASTCRGHGALFVPSTLPCRCGTCWLGTCSTLVCLPESLCAVSSAAPGAGGVCPQAPAINSAAEARSSGMPRHAAGVLGGRVLQARRSGLTLKQINEQHPNSSRAADIDRPPRAEHHYVSQKKTAIVTTMPVLSNVVPAPRMRNSMAIVKARRGWSAGRSCQAPATSPGSSCGFSVPCHAFSSDSNGCMCRCTKAF